jgi:hypothetical protein
LIKDPQARPSATDLLQHTFVRMWEREEMDVGNWVRAVLAQREDVMSL